MFFRNRERSIDGGDVEAGLTQILREASEWIAIPTQLLHALEID